MSQLTQPCPSCGREVHLSTLTTGDTVWCPCNALLRVIHGDGASQLAKVGAMPAAPRRPRRRPARGV